MSYYVCSGAKLKYSMGSEQSELEVVHLTERVLLCGKPMANIMDSKPLVNIKPFGKCSSLANPVVAAATSANYGRLQKMPCIPNTPFPWLNGKMNLIIKGSQALLSTSKCSCVWAAAIEVADPGQNTVREDGPMNITITEPTLETQQALGRGFQSSQDGAASSSQAVQSSSSETQSSSSSSFPSSAAVAQSSSSVAQSTLSVDKVEGATETYPRQKIVYKVTKYNKEKYEMSEEDNKKISEIKWAVKLGEDGNNIIELKDVGEKITLDIKPEWDSKEIKDILVMAYIDNYSETVSQKTKVLEDPYKGTLIRGVVGGDEASVGHDVEYSVTNSNKDGSASEVNEGSDVKWAIKVGKNGGIDKTMLGGERGKKAIVLKMKEEWAGKEITIMPYLNSPTATVSVVTRVEKGIILKGLPEEQKKILDILGELTNDELEMVPIEGTCYVMVKIKEFNVNNSNGELPLGTELIRELIQQNGLTKTIKISIVEGNSYVYPVNDEDWKKARDGSGTNAIIDFNMNVNGKIVVPTRGDHPEETPQERSMLPHIILAHELIHAYHIVNGISESKERVEYIHNYPRIGEKEYVDEEELYTIGLTDKYKDEYITENKIRKEQGEKIRIAYWSDD